jgi:electron transfer flavoprotein alpha subunit
MNYIDDLQSAPEPRDIWVVAELGADGQASPLSLEILGGARMMADGLGCYVHAVVMGAGLGEVAPQLIAAGADRVHVADDGALADALAHADARCKVLGDLLAAQPPEVLLLGATRAAEDVAPRLAQRFNTGLLAHCISLQMDDMERMLIGTHPVFNGEYYELAACPSARPAIATIEPDAFGPPYLDSYRFGETETVAMDLSGFESRVHVSGPVEYTPPEVPLRQAKRIVSAGRQAGDFELARQLADALGAHVAGAREATDEGWITEEQVVGATGETVRPDLYVAVGIRGDTYHAFGIRDAKFVVAIHPEKDAPILKSADAALVGDPAKIVPELIEALK